MRTLKIHTLIKYNSDKKAARKISTSPLNKHRKKNFHTVILEFNTKLDIPCFN